MAQSIMQDKKECFVTGRTDNLEVHHCLDGSRRKKADKWGLVVYLTHDTHQAVHFGDSKLIYALRRAAQKRFEELYSHELWMKEFGKNYL